MPRNAANTFADTLENSVADEMGYGLGFARAMMVSICSIPVLYSNCFLVVVGELDRLLLTAAGCSEDAIR